LPDPNCLDLDAHDQIIYLNITLLREKRFSAFFVDYQRFALKKYHKNITFLSQRANRLVFGWVLPRRFAKCREGRRKHACRQTGETQIVVPQKDPETRVAKWAKGNKNYLFTRSSGGFLNL
jgi:hypothetical protein